MAELEDALQRERVDKVERLQVRGAIPPCAAPVHAPQMLQAEAEGEIGRLSSDMQQLQVRHQTSAAAAGRGAMGYGVGLTLLQMQTQDAGVKGKQIKELSRRAIEKLDAALRDEKAAVRTLKSRAAEAEERERRLAESHVAELGVLQKRLRAAELRSKELQVRAGARDSACAA